MTDIPVVGALFGHKDRISIERQVIIYVTPHLWTPGLERPLWLMSEFMLHVPPFMRTVTPSEPEAPEAPEALEDLEIPED